ncbi:MAG: export transporter permease LptF [Verrucomicrobiaceae bacterium]|nr:export transporter permease LptF [Verrucomicrobiaceae bacterium]
MILFRYITREILLTMLAVSFTLLVIVISSRLVTYLNSAASGDIPPSLVFSIIFFRMPGFLELILPLAFFISVLLALGRFYVDSEMVVIAACGISPQRLFAMVLAPALLVALLVAAISLFISPYTTLRAQTMLNDAGNASGLESLGAGQFRVINQGRGRVTYVDKLADKTNEMLGVFAADRYTENDGSSRQVILVAERGHTETDAESSSRFLVLQNGTRYIGQPGDAQFQVMDFAKLGQQMDQESRRPLYRKQNTLTTAELFHSRRADSKATLQWRFSLGLLVLVSTLTAVALARTDHRRGRYGKLFPAFLLFMLYLVLLNAAREGVGNQRIPVNVGLWWVHGLFVIVGAAFLMGPDRLRTWRSKRLSTVRTA